MPAEQELKAKNEIYSDIKQNVYMVPKISVISAIS